MLEGAAWIEAPSNMDIELECMTILEQNEELQGNSGAYSRNCAGHTLPSHQTWLAIPVKDGMHVWIVCQVLAILTCQHNVLHAILIILS
jgi:hypothetical protein